MSITARIQADTTAAAKAKDRERLTALRLVLDALNKEAKEARGTLDEQREIAVLKRERKRRAEAAEAYRKGGREDAAKREEAEMALLRGYLPAGMTSEQVESEVRAVIAELKPTGPNAFGAVMKAATARLAGRAEGAQVAAAARKLLAS